jgi:hypothetical protein
MQTAEIKTTIQQLMGNICRYHPEAQHHRGQA